MKTAPAFMVLEVVVSLLIFSMTVLCLLQLSSAILSVNNEVALRTRALNIACDILEGGTCKDKRFIVRTNKTLINKDFEVCEVSVGCGMRKITLVTGRHIE